MSYSPFELEPSWQQLLIHELQKPYMLELAAFIAKERLSSIPIYPPEGLVFNAFKYTPYDQVKVVIVGQDPYHGPGQAHGLSFSVPKGVPLPRSLENIMKEMNADIGTTIPSHGCLLSWAQQGVLLLNATLTVREGAPMSHYGKGWEMFTDAVITLLCKRRDPLVLLLWGKSAQSKCRHINDLAKQNGHIILSSSHPSPLSAHQGFFGSKPFSKINEILEKWKKKTIDWQIK